jgi:predicted transposase YdaD
MVKAKNTPKPDSGNIYDKVLKENAEVLIRAFVGARIRAIGQIKDKIQTTLERELDFVYKAELEAGDEELIHLEFQANTEPLMHERMLLYHALLRYKYHLPVRQLVVYLGAPAHGMTLEISGINIHFKLQVLSLNELDPETLIRSQVPEVIVLGILAKHKEEQKEVLLRSIVSKLRQVCHDELKLRKYLKQLQVLSRLRKFDPTLIQNYIDMPIIDISADSYYQLGMEKGVEKGIEKGIEKGMDIVLEIIKLYRSGKTLAAIAKKSKLPTSAVVAIIEKAKKDGIL